LPPAYALVVAFAVFVIRPRRFSSIGPPRRSKAFSRSSAHSSEHTSPPSRWRHGLRGGADARFCLRIQLVACAALYPGASCLLHTRSSLPLRYSSFAPDASRQSVHLDGDAAVDTEQPGMAPPLSAPPAILFQSRCVSIGQHIHSLPLHRRNPHLSNPSPARRNIPAASSSPSFVPAAPSARRHRACPRDGDSKWGYNIYNVLRAHLVPLTPSGIYTPGA
jgi:hypothetical protein